MCVFLKLVALFSARLYMSFCILYSVVQEITDNNNSDRFNNSYFFLNYFAPGHGKNENIV